jgi:hypothetical protein
MRGGFDQTPEEIEEERIRNQFYKKKAGGTNSPKPNSNNKDLTQTALNTKGGRHTRSRHMCSRHKHGRHMRSRHKHKHMSHRGHKHKHVHSEYMMHGGNPLVGSAYDATAAVPKGNYYSLSGAGIPSGLPVPPINSNSQFSQGGGGKYKKKQRGGSSISEFMSKIIPQDILNISRSIPAAASNMMDRFNGLSPQPDNQVYPTQQPIIQQLQKTPTNITPPDITKAFREAM